MATPNPDILADVLRAVRLEGTAYFQADFAAPWAMSFAGSDFANFHLVSAGNCWVSSESLSEPQRLEAGSLVVFPHGSSHRLAGDMTTEPLPAKDLIEQTERRNGDRLVYGGDGERCTLICGHFDYDRTGAHPLWSALPNAIVLSGESGSIFDTAAQMTIAAAESSEPGSRAVVDRLAEILLIQIIRAYADSGADSGPQDGFVAALADDTVGRVIRAIHADPGRAWSVAELSSVAGLSRSALASSFQRLVGQSPMQYVTTWRMHCAKELLSSTTLHLADVAEKVGYESEWSFAKAYKRTFGEGPGATRRKRTA